MGTQSQVCNGVSAKGEDDFAKPIFKAGLSKRRPHPQSALFHEHQVALGRLRETDPELHEHHHALSPLRCTIRVGGLVRLWRQHGCLFDHDEGRQEKFNDASDFVILVSWWEGTPLSGVCST